MKNFKLVWSARSECGPNRKKNEDSIYPSTSGNNQPPFKAAVCDGLGGHVSGDNASKIAPDTLNEEVEDIKKVINQVADIVDHNILKLILDNPYRVINGDKIKIFDINNEKIQSYDLVLIATDHDKFDFDLVKNNAKIIIDSRGRYNKEENIFPA